MKRGILIFCALVLIWGNGCASADSSRSSVLMEQSTGRILYEHNAHEPLPMASTTKIMTALLALEKGNLSDRVKAGPNAFGVPGTSIYLAEGEILSLEQMLYGLMLSSGNDAAVAIAEHIGGSVSDFCKMMTQRAEEIGCENTVFFTPHGLPSDGHHTTACDLALIAREAMKNEVFRKIVGTEKMQIPWENHAYNRVLTNKNKLLRHYQGATGIKTGYTRKAGRCLVFSAQRNGMEVVGAVLNCDDWFHQAEEIMDQGFEKYEMILLKDAGESIGQVEIENGVTDCISVCTEKTLAVPMKKGTWPKMQINLPEKLPAGIMQGDKVGNVTVWDEDQLLLEAPLTAMQDAPKANFRFGCICILENWCMASE